MPDVTRAPSRGLTLLNGLLLTELVGLVFLFGCFRQIDMDIWWHLATGQRILARGELPRHDWFTYTVPDHEWIDLHWLFQVGATGLYALGGMPLLTLASASLGAVAVAVLLAARPVRGSWPVIVACWFPAVVLLSGRLYVRPEIVTLVCLALLLLVLFYAGRRPRLLWLLVPLEIFWVNVQGLFILGPILLALYGVDGAWRALCVGRSAILGRRLLVLAAVVAACFVNPYGLNGVLLPWELFRKMSWDAAFYGAHIAELESIPAFLARTGYVQMYLLTHLGLLVLGGVSFVLAWSRRRFDLFRLLAFAAFGWLGLQATRNSGQFALVAGAVTAWNCADWSCDRAVRAGVARLGRSVLAALLALAIVAVASGWFYRAAGEGRLVGLGEQPFWHAHDAARFARRPGMPGHVIAYHLGQAALVEFHMRDDQRVFCDPRLEVMSRELLERYEAIQNAAARGDPAFDTLLGAAEAPAILTDHRVCFAMEATLLASSRWRCAFFDPVAAVFLRDDASARADAPAVDFAARHFSHDAGAERAAGPAAVWPWGGAEPDAGFIEAEALVRVARRLQESGAARSRRVPALLLLALDRACAGSARHPAAADGRRVLGQTFFHFASDPTVSVRASSAEPAGWDPMAMLDSARARYWLERTLDAAPNDFVALGYLFQLALLERDVTAARDIAGRLRARGAHSPSQREVLAAILREAERFAAAQASDGTARDGAAAAPNNLEELRRRTEREVAQARPDRAMGTFRLFLGTHGKLPWLLADRYASLLLRAGDPERARGVWSDQVTGDYDRATERERVASTYHVEGKLDLAIENYRAALRYAPTHTPAAWGLTRAYLETGDAAAVVRECDWALAHHELAPGVRTVFQAMADLARPYAPPDAVVGGSAIGDR